MKTLKIVGNIFGIIFAIVFSIALVAVLVVIPPAKSLSSVFQANTIQAMAVDVVNAEMIESGLGMPAELEEMGISNELFQEIIASDATEELLNVYLDDVFSAVDGEDVESSLTPELLEDIVDDNKQELVSLIEEYADVEDKKAAEALLDEIVEGHSEDILEILPSVEENMSTVPNSGDDELFDVWNAIRGLYNGTVLWSMIGVAAVLSLLIFLCRGFKLQGFMWLGVSYAIAAVFSAFVIMLINNISTLMHGISHMESTMINSLVSGMVSSIVMGTLVIAALAVVFIATYIIGKTCLKKKVQNV